jgi:chromate reductase
MSVTPRILVFGGSLRRDSYNQKLAAIVAEGVRAAGGEATLIALRDYPMPLFDGDLEEASGLPENAKKLKSLFVEHDGFIISSPEYNSSITAVLKNTIDWVSRTETDDEPDLIAFTGKAAALCSASPGALGGMRSLVHVRSILSNLGVLMLPKQVSVGKAYAAFNEDGTLIDAKQTVNLHSMAAGLVNLLKKTLA